LDDYKLDTTRWFAFSQDELTNIALAIIEDSELHNGRLGKKFMSEITATQARLDAAENLDLTFRHPSSESRNQLEND